MIFIATSLPVSFSTLACELVSSVSCTLERLHQKNLYQYAQAFEILSLGLPKRVSEEVCKAVPFKAGRAIVLFC
jgi:hypothetical protein